MMPPDDSIVPVILPEPAATSPENVYAPGYSRGTPNDVAHWFDLETIVELPAPVAGFDDAADAAAQYRQASRAENTRCAYRAAVARFCDWCTAHTQTAWPVLPEIITAFLAAEARDELAVTRCA